MDEIVDRPSPGGADAILREWQAEGSAERKEQLLGELLWTHARPVVARVIGAHWATLQRVATSEADAEDLAQRVHVQVLRALRRDEGAIASFLPYVAAVARNAVNLAIRRTNPEWSSMANAVRYVLNHQPQLALWRLEDHRDIAGFAGDRGRTPVGEATFPPDAEARFIAEHGRDLHRARSKVELVVSILRAAGGPIPLQAVVRTALRWCARPDTRTTSLDAAVAEDLPLSATIASRQPGVERALVSREIILQLWKEIRGLGELVHRRVLLLNLSEGVGAAVETFEEQHICTIGDIADTLEYEREWFAALCNRLPLSDAEIGAMLSLTADQVSARRKSARRTLGRRLAANFASLSDAPRQGSRRPASTE